MIFGMVPGTHQAHSKYELLLLATHFLTNKNGIKHITI